MENPKKIAARTLIDLLRDIRIIEDLPIRDDFFVRGDSAGNFVVVDGEDILLGYIDVGKETYERFESITEGEDES